MKITLNQAIELLGLSASVIVDDVVCFPSIQIPLIGNDSSYFLQVKSINNQGKNSYMSFMEGPNREVELIGCSLFLFNTEGDKKEIILLEKWQVESSFC